MHTAYRKAKEKVVAPVRERGLKWCIDCLHGVYTNSRSREGAWIEIKASYYCSSEEVVAPVRERGLKSLIALLISLFFRSLP